MEKNSKHWPTKISPSQIWNIKEQITLDVTGHYQRNDIFDLQVNHERK